MTWTYDHNAMGMRRTESVAWMNRQGNIGYNLTMVGFIPDSVADLAPRKAYWRVMYNSSLVKSETVIWNYDNEDEAQSKFDETLKLYAEQIAEYVLTTGG